MEHRSTEEDTGAIALRMASVPPIDSKYNEKNVHAGFAMQRMSILIIKMRSVFNDSYPSRERSFRAESQALAPAIKGSL